MTDLLTDQKLLDILGSHYGNVDDLIDRALWEDTGPGVCAECGTVHEDVGADESEGVCEECGSLKVKGVCVIAGVV